MVPEAMMRTVPVVPMMEMVAMSEVMAVSAKVTMTAEMTAAAMEATVTVPMAHLNDAIVGHSAKFRSRQRLRGRLRRGEHDQTRHCEKA